jgi:3-deoxy-manno-octulosonate cytidylyltransferase (CMP-KDO synthetase)
MKDKVLGVIPARLHSTRFPEKVLYKIKGKPLLQWVWEGAKEAHFLNDLIVATDSEKVKDMVLSFGGKAILTSPEHQSGTDRLGEIALNYPEYSVLVNIQGDEPLIKIIEDKEFVPRLCQPDKP